MIRIRRRTIYHNLRTLLFDKFEYEKDKAIKNGKRKNRKGKKSLQRE